MLSLIAICLALLIIFYFFRNEIEVKVKYFEKPSKRTSKIGIVSDWHRKGVPYQSRFLSLCLSGRHDVHIFAYTDYVKDEADWGYKKLVFTKVIKPWKVINWIKNEGLKLVFFPDRLEDPQVLDWCRKNKVATVMIINYETVKKEEFGLYGKYSVLMCPVKCTYDLLKKNGVRKLRFVRWAVDDTSYKPGNAAIKTTVRFIHNAGYGGIEWRKNTLAVVEAFDTACQRNKNVVLILKTQRPIKEYPGSVLKIVENNGRIRVVEKDLKMNELIELYRTCHVSVLPSKWEGIGIPFIESLSLGLPVITVDAPPMNEWVKKDHNGLTVRVKKWETRKDRKLLVKGAVVDTDDLARQMLKLTDPSLIARMGRNAAKSAIGIRKRFTKEVEKLVDSL